MEKNKVLFKRNLILLFSCTLLQTLHGQAFKDQLKISDSLSSIADRIDDYLMKSAANGYSGSVLVAKEGEILISKGYGWAHRASNIPCKPSTVYNIGSVTKQFTAAAVLKLVEQQKVQLSDQLSKFYPNIPEDKKDITLHQLLTHTSGLQPSAIGFRYDEATKEDFKRVWFHAPLWTAPGTQHRYANANYTILADIIEKVSGIAYATFLQQYLWEPSQLEHTGYKDFTIDEHQLAHGYEYDFTDGKWRDWGVTKNNMPAQEKHWFSIGKGDVESTTEDLYKWHLALQDHTVLTKESTTLLETPFVAENEDNTSFYGYGWSVFYTQEGKKVVWHNGSNGIYFGNMVRFPEEDVVVIVLSNIRLNPDSENVAWEISKMLSDEHYTPKPVTKLSYALVHEFMQTHGFEESDMLHSFLTAELGQSWTDKGVFNRMGFALLAQEKEPGWGLELLRLNVTLFQEDGNLWDSLGEGYWIYGQQEEAIHAFQKALALGAGKRCHWCEHATKRLKELSTH